MRAIDPNEATVLKGSDGRRWLQFGGTGRVFELKDGAPPLKPKRRAPPKGQRPQIIRKGRP